MTDASEEDEEVKNTVHILLLVEGIEDCTCDVGDAFSDEPYDGSGRDGIQQGLEGYEDTQAHADETEGLDIGMLFEFDETNDGTCYSACPNKDKQYPSPITMCTQGYQCQW